MLGSTVGTGGQMGSARYSTDALQKEMALTDMGLSAVYMHELRFRKKVSQFLAVDGRMHIETLSLSVGPYLFPYVRTARKKASCRCNDSN